MNDVQGNAVTLIALDKNGIVRPLRVDADGNLMVVTGGGSEAGGGDLMDAVGKLLAPVGFDPDELPQNFLVDDNGYLKVAFGSGGAGMSLIEDQLLEATAANVEFSDIAATYKQLRLEYEIRTTRSVGLQYANCRINDLTSAIYYYYTTLHHYNNAWDDSEGLAQTSFRFARVPGTGADSGHGSGGFIVFSNSYDGEFYKSVYGMSQAIDDEVTTDLFIRHFSAAIKTKDAISKIKIYPESSGNFAIGSRFSLYGLS